MITGTVPPKIVIPEPVHRINDGVRVIANEPYMRQEAEEERWVYAPKEHHYYFNTETSEIRLFKNTEMPSE